MIPSTGRYGSGSWHCLIWRIFTDFDALAAEPAVALAFLDRLEDAEAPDLLILPGSKQTLDDLEWLHCRGLARGIQNFHGRAGILGICGGMQMLGQWIEDPDGAENHGSPRSGRGLELLPIRTILNSTKVTRLVQGCVEPHRIFGQELETRNFQGYEIHLGETAYAEGAEPFARIARVGEGQALPDGAVRADRSVYGTYVHGLFTDDAFRHSFIRAARAACGLAPAAILANFSADREGKLDRLAEHVRRAIDLKFIKSCIGL